MKEGEREGKIRGRGERRREKRERGNGGEKERDRNIRNTQDKRNYQSFSHQKVLPNSFICSITHRLDGAECQLKSGKEC